MATIGLVRDNVITNAIVIDDNTPPGFLDDLVEQGDYDRHVNLDELASDAGIGYAYRKGAGYTLPDVGDPPPLVLGADDEDPAP